jgi:DNA ligase D-like protein (predicted 3'-phosphoesterase)
MGLAEYREKRDDGVTPEPEGQAGAPSTGSPRFVIQKHDASTLHYDLRLEADGVLISWAVPKGPSTDPRDRRLAVRTEDHPLDYATFEGVIPEDEYGGGAVLVWDTGTFDNLTTDDDVEVPVGSAVDDGHVVVRLHGEKISGGYALTRTDGDRWLLVKVDDDDADARRNPESTQPDSVLSGRGLDDVAAEEQG